MSQGLPQNTVLSRQNVWRCQNFLSEISSVCHLSRAGVSGHLTGPKRHEVIEWGVRWYPWVLVACFIRLLNQIETPQLKSCFREKCRLFLKLLNKELKVVSGTYSTKSAITQPSRVGRRRHKHKNLLISTRRRRERSVGPPMVFMLDLCLVSGCQVARRLANGRSGILMLHLWEILVM